MDVYIKNPKITEVTSLSKNISFSFYSSVEIDKISVVEIFCPAFFNSNNKIIEWGLCDIRLGTFTSKEYCFSCNENYSTCPGHSGHIELTFPVTTPLVRNILNSILNSKCWYCGYFRLSSWKTKLFYIKLVTLDLGLSVKKFCKILTKFLSCNSNKNLDFKCNIKIINIVEEKLKKYIQKRTFLNFFLIDIVYAQKNRNYFVRSFLQKNTSGQFCYRCEKAKNPINNNLITKKFKNLVFFKKKKSFYFIRNKICFQRYSEFFYHDNRYFRFRSFQAKKHLRCIWKYENNLCEFLWGFGLKSKKFTNKNSCEIFFVSKLLIPPTRFRPVYVSKIYKSKQKLFSNFQNFYFLKIIKLNQQLLLTIGINVSILKKIIGYSLFLEFEETISNLFDNSDFSSGFSKTPCFGIRQQLEKKLGLFRMHLMGKRVNHSARTIVVPDPFLKSSQTGFPSICGKKISTEFILNRFNLSFFTSSMDVKNMKKYQFLGIKNIQTIFGKKSKILQKKHNIQIVQNIYEQYFEYYICKRLNKFGLTKFFRTLITGDLVLLNRQPSLHRSSVMAHKVILRKKTKCLSLNYMNCSPYNADFDGDEMNIHVTRGYLAKAESLILSLTDNHIKIPTHSFFIRSLIQDHIISAVQLTNKDMFFSEDFFFQLLHSIFNESFIYSKFSYPSIIKPMILWTGKQLISLVMTNIFSFEISVCFESRNKIHKLIQGQDETLILIRNGELLRGILDSTQLGKSKYGVLHAFYEKYGPEKTDTFLTILSLFFIIFQRNYGHSAQLSDLIVSRKIDIFRTKGFCKEKVIKKILVRKVLSKKGFFLKDKNLKNKNIFYFLNFGSFLFTRKILTEDLILHLRSILTKISTNLVENNLPEDLQKNLSKNDFLLMILSGSKGSFVNFFQIATSLGQMEFEGKFIFRNKMAKNLPSFFPYEVSGESSGFIFQRFLTGLSSSDYFFHCMTGRESLLDTTVKTSQSGYIQRNLIKHLENLKLNYDLTVKTGINTTIQLIYWKDGINPTGFDFDFSLSWYFQNLINDFLFSTQIVKNLKSHTWLLRKNNMILSSESCSHLQNISEKFYNTKKFTVKNFKIFLLDNHLFKFYQKNLYQPGEPIGVITGQSVGEPCTQMTLNTFHLAGKTASSFNIGIPRLKEILLLASKYPKNPTTSVYFQKNLNFKNYISIQKRLKKILLCDLIQTIVVYKKKTHLILKIRLISRNRYKHQLLLEIFFIKNQFRKFWKTIEFKFTISFKILKFFKIKKNGRVLSFFCTIGKKKNFFSGNNHLIDIIQVEFLKFYNLAFSFYIKKNFMVDFYFIDFREKLVHFKGINFYIFWTNFDLMNINKLFTNDVYEILLTYGIEGCRKMLCEELENIFQIQAILINKQHLNLISDYMTKMGIFKAFNRMEMDEEKGFQRITYETALSFIIDAAINKIFDRINSPSSSLCVGKTCTSGSGYADISYIKK